MLPPPHRPARPSGAKAGPRTPSTTDRLDVRQWAEVGRNYARGLIRALKPGDLEFIGRNLTQADLREIDAARPGRAPLDVVRRSALVSRRIWVGALTPRSGLPPRDAPESGQASGPAYGPDVPVALFGLADHPLRQDWGVPWMLATPGFGLHPVAAATRSRRVVRAMLALRQGLENHVHARHSVAIRWLRFCGFTIHPLPVTMPETGERFLRFTLAQDSGG